MRNLKRALSLTLASVMLLGMMVFGTSAASFTDADQISNVTAATVLQELEVMQGSNGKFSPNQTVTRGQMAILICKMLYGNKLNAENFAGTSEFTDVPANAYYTGYVNLASQLGIISGYGNGKFGPGAPVTTAQAALMLTRALGWFQAGELEDQSWTSNAIAAVERATAVNLFGSMKLGNNEPLSRDNVCEMVFNAMTKTAPVNYNSRWEMYYSDESSIMSGVKFNYLNSLGYKNYTLVYSATTDDFGRPSTEWGIGDGKLTYTNNVDDHGDLTGKVTIKTSFLEAADDADAVYTKEAKSEDIYKDLGLTKDVTAKLVVDGGKADTFAVEKNNDKTKIGGNGVLVEAYKDGDNNVTITVINPYIGEIAKVTEAKGNNARTVTVDGLKFETEGFAEDDLVIYTKADGEIKTMTLAKKVEGLEVTRVKEDSEFTAGGDVYKYISSWTKKDGKTKAADAIYDSSLTDVKTENILDLYLDSYGYVVKLTLSEGTTNYAYVLDIGNDNSRFGSGTPYAKLLLTDGTVVEAKLDKDDYKGKGGITGSETGEQLTQKLTPLFEGFIVEYSKSSKDVYKLEAKNTAGQKMADANVTVDSGKAKMTLGGSTVYADSKTIFLVDDDDDNYSAYNGYNAVPDMEATGTATISYYCKTGTVATVVYVKGVDAGADNVLYLLGSECGKKITVKDGDYYYECPAVLDGEIVTVKLDEKASADALYSRVYYSNADEEIIDFSKTKEKTFEVDPTKDEYCFNNTIKAKLSNGNLVFTKSIGGADTFAVADGVKVFEIDGDEISSSRTGSITVGSDVTVIVKDGKISNIFFVAAEDTGDNTNPTEVPDVEVSSTNWNKTADNETRAIEVTLKFKLGETVDLDTAESAVAAEVEAQKGWTYTDECAESTDTNSYVLVFKDKNDNLKYVKFAKTQIADGTATVVAEANTAEEAAAAFTNTKVKEVVVNVDADIPSGNTKPVTVAEGVTVTLKGTTAGAGKITGKGVTKVNTEITDAQNIKTEGGIELAGGSLEGAVSVPVKVTGDAEIKTNTGKDVVVTLEGEGGKDPTLTLSRSVTALPKIEGEGKVSIGGAIASEGKDTDAQLDDLASKIGNSEQTKAVPESGEKVVTITVKNNGVALTGTGSLEAWWSGKKIDELITVSDKNGKSVSLFSVTLTGLQEGDKITGQKKIGAEWVGLNGVLNPDTGVTVEKGKTTHKVQLLLADTVSEVKFTITPKSADKE